jgi:hypothetical protein
MYCTCFYQMFLLNHALVMKELSPMILFHDDIRFSKPAFRLGICSCFISHLYFN